ncbi:LIM domain only protein 7 isoform X5 [Homalodisca vitripennis]|uniref:LIM domain only protein 7 isoform X5 n=1 Tax=Homalodisca vitripennis TaxID=197043 RepID=UPI001EEC8614|nr:LIM domain only protein 7 isoform X5 [Homalodisca vitripennis]
MPAVQPAPGAASGATPAMQRRHSSASSSDTGSDPGLPASRHTSQENIALIPTRMTKVATSKPAANPLQFVKVGPCDLSRYAQEQLKKAEEIKKVKPERRDEAEDWQSNLDNWKVSRRKRQEHIIERVVEVKKLELEEHDRNRRRSKTFNEMLEERNSKGRKTSLPVFQDDDNDLSDLGLSTPKTNGEDSVFHEGKEPESSSDDVSSACSTGMNGEKGSTNGHLQREPSSEQEEYTYERAIQNYVNFTESRVRGRSLTPSGSDSSKLTNGFSKKSSPPIPAKPRRGSCKIEEKLSELEEIKKKSMSTNDLTENTKRPLSVPKVDILKRREMFEKSQEEETPSVKNRLSGDFGSSKSIRDRVSSLGKPAEDVQSIKKINRLSAEVSVKDRLSSIEKQKSIETMPTKSNTSQNDNITITNSVKDRLTSLQKMSSSSEQKQTNIPSQVTVAKVEVKEKILAKNSVTKEIVPARIPESNEKNGIAEINSENKDKERSMFNGAQKEEEISVEELREKSTFSPTEDMYESKRQQHYRHRSLDSLDVESNDGVGNESFERVQSLEDLDFCRNYPPSSVSGDTDREDSGIHTADVSSSVSQADDCDLHLDSEFHQQPTILEEINKNSDLTTNLIIKQTNQINKLEGVHHLSALTVDVTKPDLSCPIMPINTHTLSMPIFPDTDSTKLIESIEVVFPLSPSTLEPPKEKPPPPPTEISDDDDTTNTSSKPVSLRRLDSTKRIKKEIRQKRSSFLGIEGSNDDNYLEPELELVRRPPDITSFLAEEKRLEQLLYRQSICSESESRDSGVELEKHHDDLPWSPHPGHHSRDNSETYANTSTTSEEEEIVKKEREIIEMLEREEINSYTTTAQDEDNIGEKLAERLRELEAEKTRLEWAREEEMSRRKAEEAVRAEQQSRIQARELELCKQENTQAGQELDKNMELLMAERERLEAEQASLARQRDVLLQHQYNLSLTDVRVSEPTATPSYRRSMQDLRVPEPAITCYRQPADPPTTADNRRSMPNLATQPRRPPPPIPPAKPLIIPRTQDKRTPSPSTQQMTRQTLQALSAAPKPRLNDNWVQAKRKPNNYQHWLIQEAEQRRITEHHQRQAPPPRRPVPPPPQQNGGSSWGSSSSGSSGQYTNWQPAGGQWGAPHPPTPRSDKPLPDSIIQTLTQRVQNRLHTADPNNNRRRMEQNPVIEHRPQAPASDSQEKMLSVSGKKKCSHCGDELGRGAAMIIESLRLFYHIDCFKCCVCCVQLGDGLMGTDVRVRNNKLHCHNCYSSDDGVKFSCV